METVREQLCKMPDFKCICVCRAYPSINPGKLEQLSLHVVTRALEMSDCNYMFLTSLVFLTAVVEGTELTNNIFSAVGQPAPQRAVSATYLDYSSDPIGAMVSDGSGASLYAVHPRPVRTGSSLWTAGTLGTGLHSASTLSGEGWWETWSRCRSEGRAAW